MRAEKIWVRDKSEVWPDTGLDFTRRTATLTSRDGDKHSEWGGMARLSQK